MVEVPPTDQWRLRYLTSLLEKRQILHYMGDKEEGKAVAEVIASLCVN